MTHSAEREIALEAIDVHKRFGAKEVLRGIDMTVERGQVVCLLGPSGSGKSTFLRCLNQLEKPDAGRIILDGELIGYARRSGRLHELKPGEVSRQIRRMGMVFQRFNLFKHMTALQNVMEAPIGVGRVRSAEVRKEATALLDRVGLSDFYDAYPAQLSGGQQQRVAIARALAMKPSLMLFDEPTSALDPELVGDVLQVMRDLAASGMTMIVVTHEIGFARDVADWVVFIDGGQIVEQGPPSQVLDNPQRHRTRAFLQLVPSGASGGPA